MFMAGPGAGEPYDFDALSEPPAADGAATRVPSLKDAGYRLGVARSGISPGIFATGHSRVHPFPSPAGSCRRVSYFCRGLKYGEGFMVRRAARAGGQGPDAVAGVWRGGATGESVSGPADAVQVRDPAGIAAASDVPGPE